MSQTEQKVDNSLIGAAGVHFVASELSLRGLIALPTVRNTAGIDLIVASVNGKWHANLQVKSSKNKVSFWPVGSRYKEWHGRNCFYVFVRYLKEDSRFEAFLESAERVARQVETYEKESERHGYATWAPCWYLPEEKRNIQKVKTQWKKFGPGHLA